MQKAGFIGLGIMGKPMAENLIKNGVALAVFTRSGVPDTLTQAGAVACDSPAAVAAQADVIFVMVPDTPDVERVLFGENGVVAALRAGQVVVDMSSISPIATREFAAKVRERGADYLDAPVGRVTGADVPMPYSKPLEQAAMPHEEHVVHAALATFRDF